MTVQNEAGKGTAIPATAVMPPGDFDTIEAALKGAKKLKEWILEVPESHREWALNCLRSELEKKPAA